MTRRAWYAVTAGYALLAIGFTVVALVVVGEVHRLDNTQRTIRATQKAAATIAVHNAGAICLGLTAPTKHEEMAIIDSFLQGDGTVVRLFTPRCKQVALKAAEDIFGIHALPPELELELTR